MNNSNAVPLEVMSPDAASGVMQAIVKGEIDQQVATAHRYPRDMTTFQKRAMNIVALDEETAESCIYVRPVGKQFNKDTRQMEEKFAEGMSVRMAEIVAACYGNIRAGAQIVSQTERQVVARGFAHDLEANNASTSECVESTVKRDGTPYDERMRIVVAKAALSKAYRDAVFKVVPRALCKKIEAEARKIIAGNKKPLEVRRAAVAEWVSKLNIDEARVWATLNVKGPADLTEEHLLTITGIRTALKEDLTIDEAFPPIVKKKDDSDNVPMGSTAAPQEPMISLIIKACAEAGVSEEKMCAYLKTQDFCDVTKLADVPSSKVPVIFQNLKAILVAALKFGGSQPTETADKPKRTTKTTVNPAPTPTSQAAPAEAPAPTQSGTMVNYLKGVKGMMKLGGIEEVELLTYCRGSGLFDESLNNLEEVNTVSPEKLKLVYDQWAAVEKSIKAARSEKPASKTGTGDAQRPLI